MQEIADEVLLDHEITAVDVDHERQLVHVFEHRTFGRPAHVAVRSIRESRHRGELAAPRHFLDREVELVAGDEVDGRRRPERGLALDGDVGPHEPHAQGGVGRLQRLGHAHVVGKRRGARVQHREVVVAGQRDHVGEPEPGRRRVDQPAARYQRRGLGQPRRIPERPHLAPRLIPCPRPPVEPLERRRVQEQRPQIICHQVRDTSATPTAMRPMPAHRAGVTISPSTHWASSATTM